MPSSAASMGPSPQCAGATSPGFGGHRQAGGGGSRVASVGGSPRGVPEPLRSRVFTKGVAGCTLPGRLEQDFDIRCRLQGQGELAGVAPSIPGTEAWGWSGVLVSGSLGGRLWKSLSLWLSVSMQYVVLAPADCFSGSKNKMPVSQCLLQCTCSPCLFNAT